MTKPTRITNTIRSLRFANGEMTQAQLAERIGVTRQTVIAIEQGRYSPSLEMAFQERRDEGRRTPPVRYPGRADRRRPADAGTAWRRGTGPGPRGRRRSGRR